MPCVQGIDAPRVFELYNNAIIYDDWETASRIFKEEGHQILRCTSCRTCTIRCRNEIAIPEWLEAVKTNLE